MSAELYDAEHEGALARPAIDILPMPGGRKAKAAPVEEQAVAPEPAPAEWAAPLATGPNPWSDPAPEPAAVAAMAPPSMAPPVLAPSSAPAMSVSTAEVPGLADLVEEAPAEAAPKKFLGLQIRRTKKVADPSPEQDAAEAVEAAEPTPEPYPASAPLAAWPTDVAMPVVAHAEPAEQPVPTAPDTTPVDFAPVEAAPVEATDTIQMQPVAPMPADDTELRALRAMVDASEAGRVEADNRAALAVAYAQAAQAQLSEANNKAQAQIQAAEARARSAANDAQDWQIRHREADATIAELAISVASAEQRLAELRTERDDLLASLEHATRPDHESSAT